MIYKCFIYNLMQLKLSSKYLNNVFNPYSLFTGVLAVGLVVLNLHWLSIFLIALVVGGVGLCASQYLGSQGILASTVISVLCVFIKTFLLFRQSLLFGFSEFYIIGDYAALVDGFFFQLSLSLDLYSLCYILLTSAIGVWALLFSSIYMRAEPRINSFILLLYFFLLSMILLLSSGNLPTLMLGWELIGCFSFLLINFWTTRIATAKSAIKAFFFNKLSDVALIGSLIILVIYLPNSVALNMSNLYLLQGCHVSLFGLTLNVLTFCVVCLLICSFCKSAQLGFHIWLPDSMEAPVPASALIHSATLVSAGIFLMGRNEVLTCMSEISAFMLVWCSLTSLYGGVVAAYQTDLKKILAYSTISHCGFLFILVVYNNFWVLALYLHLHGWFKSYSFMAAGNIISKYRGYQDYRRMGGVITSSPLESIVLCLSLLCLGGAPFTLGFFSKHYLLLSNFEGVSLFSGLCLLLAAFTGLFYSLRILYNLLFTAVRTSFTNFKDIGGGLISTKLAGSNSKISLVVFIIYPALIALLSCLLINEFPLESSFSYHSLFGFFFFSIYIILCSIYFKQMNLLWVYSYLSVKLLYLI